MKRAIAAVFVLWSSVALAQPAATQAAVVLRHGRDLRAAQACSALEDSRSPGAVVPVTDRASGSSQTSHGVLLVLGASALALLGGGLGLELGAETQYDAARSELTSRPLRDSLYSSANTNRYLAEALAAGGLAAGGAAVWLYLRDGDHRRGAASVRALPTASVRVLPTATGLAAAGRF